ncbi:Rid family hydrolase [Virgibacillus xinjiangensis]|uniref:Rid family hydrolase n=1 Tax=Virgibacillus xinjiangensis TaxID=393090 RepID=A0ABV7CTL6_9BACI
MKKKYMAAIFLYGSALFMLVGSFTYAGKEKEGFTSGEVDFMELSSPVISNPVELPEKNDQLRFSTIAPPLMVGDGENTYERYGDTETQAKGIFENLEAQLEERDLSLSDVTHLRVYIVSDSNNGGEPDFDGFFAAYEEFFDAEEKELSPTHTVVGVDRLIDPEWLIEIEAVISSSS